jgi:hypothetical protein
MFSFGGNSEEEFSVEMSSNRVFISCLCLGLLSSLLGCNDNVGIKERPVSRGEYSMVEETESNTTAFDLLTIQFSKVSLISQEGMEVVLDPSLFQKQWDDYTETVKEESTVHYDHIYTVVAWDKESQPYVIQVSERGIKVGQNYYIGENMDHFVQWMKRYIGLEYLKSLSMERMTLQANDIGMKKQIPAEHAFEIYELIQTSTLVKGKARIDSPLYPYYQIDVEYSGKDFLQLDVLSPTLLSFRDGSDRWYYQLSDSIFSHLTDVISITDFSKKHLKHLFEADEMIARERDKIVKVGKQFNDSLKAESVIHKTTRFLSAGEVLSRSEKVDQQGNEGKVEASEEQVDPLVLQFYFADKSTTQIFVYDDYFWFNEQAFRLRDSKKTIKAYIELKE